MSKIEQRYAIAIELKTKETHIYTNINKNGLVLLILLLL